MQISFNARSAHCLHMASVRDEDWVASRFGHR